MGTTRSPSLTFRYAKTAFGTANPTSAASIQHALPLTLGCEKIQTCIVEAALAPLTRDAKAEAAAATLRETSTAATATAKQKLAATQALPATAIKTLAAPKSGGTTT